VKCEQLDLMPARAPVVSAEEVALLMNILAGRGWLTAGEIAQDWRFLDRYGLGKPGSVERRIRAMANASHGRVLSYPGSPGYKLTREATIEEIQTGTAKLRHQAGEMQARALELDRVYHGKERA
jgi:hypothetical protein